ncbi:MAG: vWA domain-containing protein [Candidatus Daviesbacteria bacterium]|nr:vWA domain-containing protein [Candidatus Daviesbacteria bacterium]
MTQESDTPDLLPSQNSQDEPLRYPKIPLSEILTPDFLKIISGASGGFSFAEDPKLKSYETGYTNMETNTIYINPNRIEYMPPAALRGFLEHEAGHHAPPAEIFQDAMLRDLANPDNIPEAYRATPQAGLRFAGAVRKHLQNGLADRWLESYMSRRPFLPVKADFDALYKNMRVQEDESLQYVPVIVGQDPETGKPQAALKKVSLPEQLIQLLVGQDRYGSKKPIQDLVDPRVYETYQKLQKTGALKALDDNAAFTSIFSTEADIRKTMERKLAAYKQVFFPEYIKLMEKELEDRKKQKQEGKGSGQGKASPGGTGGMAGDAVPLTAEEENELVDQFIRELDQAGEQFNPLAPSSQSVQISKENMDRIRKALEERQKQIDAGKVPSRPKAETPQKSGAEAIRDLADDLQRQEQERKNRGLAEGYKVRQESVQSWNRIREKYRPEINSTAAYLAEVFLDDRRKRLELLKRDGEIIPGLEYETISALISGELDPETKMITVRNPEFLETEIEFIQDRSGSMGGDRLEKSIDMTVIITEAFKKVKEDLEGEDLLVLGEEPFRIGETGFSVNPERIVKLEDPLNDEKELTIIDKASQVGGGTDETGAIAEVYQGLTLGKKNVIKMIIVLSDGEGNRAGLVPIIRQVEEDDEVIFLAVAMGKSKEEGDDVVESYLAPLRDKNKNIFGITAVDPADALPQVLEFIKKQVEARRQF